MAGEKTYAGIDQDQFGGMTPAGTIIRDAWAFGLLPEDETCAGWNHTALQNLWEKVSRYWEQYGYSVASLPADVRERHERFHREAVERARKLGWDPAQADDE